MIKIAVAEGGAVIFSAFIARSHPGLDHRALFNTLLFQLENI